MYLSTIPCFLGADCGSPPDAPPPTSHKCMECERPTCVVGTKCAILFGESGVFIPKKYFSLHDQDLYHSHSAVLCKIFCKKLTAPPRPSLNPPPVAAPHPAPAAATHITADSGNPTKNTGSLLGKRKNKPDHIMLAEIKKQIDSTPIAKTVTGNCFEFTSDYLPKCVKIQRCPKPRDVWQFF